MRAECVPKSPENEWNAPLSAQKSTQHKDSEKARRLFLGPERTLRKSPDELCPVLGCQWSDELAALEQPGLVEEAAAGLVRPLRQQLVPGRARRTAVALTSNVSLALCLP